VIKAYLKFRRGYLFLVFLIYFIFGIVHALYGYPLGSIYYSYILSGFFLCLSGLYDFVHFKNKISSLKGIGKNLSRYRHEIISSDNEVEKRYEDIIRKLYGIANEAVESQEKEHINQMEYYTMWVHQIKTPISAMSLALSSKEKPDSNLMQRELFKVEQYVEMALQYIKINRLSSDLLIKEYDLGEIINSCVKKYANLFIYKKLSIELNALSVQVLTDSKWLSFIIEQLISNAIKYTNKGGIKISWEENKLVIQDTGIGIRIEDMERIFEKGFTGYNGRLDKKASGVGLYLVRRASDSLAIKVHLSSEVGVGTKVYLSFPQDENEFVYE
jgi:signal transduction histidine kinase